MKPNLILFATLLFFSASITAQTNTFPASGRVGINTLTPTTSLQVKGGARIGTSANYLKVDSATGNLSFMGTAGYKVADNQFAFSASSAPLAGLYFNATNKRYEFRNITGNSVFNIGANAAGNVGIGTINPGAKLDVSGDALINGIRLGRGNNGLPGNIAFGDFALDTVTTGNWNTAIGVDALRSNTAGQYNIAVGYGALKKNTEGVGNNAIGYNALNENTFGNFNSANGYNALSHNTFGTYNSAGGSQAMFYNTTGVENVAYGYQTLYYNTTGNSNTAIGNNALFKNNGSENTAIGYWALYNNQFGFNNTASGTKALYKNTTGSQNVASGYASLYNNTSGSNNVATGSYALNSNTTGSQNTANGVYSLSFNTTGVYNTANGAFALNNNVSGSENTANGVFALVNNTTGSDNTALGFDALSSNTIGLENTAVGKDALLKNSLGNYNTAIGKDALLLNTYGSYNTAQGLTALTGNSTGDYNTANGFQALVLNNIGNCNTANGGSALFSNSTGNYNTALGFGADVLTGGQTNATAIGYNALVDANNKVLIGNTSVISIGGQVGWTNFSDGRIKKNIKANVPGLAFINLLKPVTYQFNLAKEYELLNKKDTINWEGKNDIEKINFTGLVAQEVDAAARKIGYDFSGVDKSGKIMGLRYSDFVTPLIKAVQELSAANDDKDEALAAQQKINQSLEDRIAKLEALLSNQVTNGNVNNGSAELKNNAGSSLEQNAPNPFSTNTIIRYHIPASVTAAQIMITDAKGNTLKTVAINTKGDGQITLNAGTLSQGTYLYSLIVDGKKVDTKQMVIIR